MRGLFSSAKLVRTVEYLHLHNRPRGPGLLFFLMISHRTKPGSPPSPNFPLNPSRHAPRTRKKNAFCKKIPSKTARVGEKEGGGRAGQSKVYKKSKLEGPGRRKSFMIDFIASPALSECPCIYSFRKLHEAKLYLGVRRGTSAVCSVCLRMR